MKGLLFASTVLMVLIIGCSSGTSDKTAPATAAPAPNAPTTVSTVAVASKKLQTTISLPAQLTPYEQVDIYPKVTGFVETVTVDRGSRVHRGQLLVKLTAPELVSQRCAGGSGGQSRSIATRNCTGQVGVRQWHVSPHGGGCQDPRCAR